MAQRFECFYGGSGSGKTTAIIYLIAKVFNESGKVARICVGDGSKQSYIEAGLVEAGVAHVMDFAIREYPLTTTQQICEGWWPEDVDNPQSKLRRLTPEEIAATGVWVIEGMSVMGAYIMGGTKGGLAYRGGQGEKIGQDSPIQIVDPSGLKFGGNPMSHYNVGQRHMLQNIQRTKALPGYFVVWSAHERLGEDMENGEKLIGPEIIGKAMTSWISREFSNTLHFTLATAVSKTTDKQTGKNVGSANQEYRVYTRDHFDPDGLTMVKYKAVNRCIIPDMMPEFVTGKAPGDNILEFYRLMVEAKKKWSVSNLIHPKDKVA